MAWFTGQLLLLLVAAFVLGVLLGRLLWAHRPRAGTSSALAAAPHEDDVATERSRLEAEIGRRDATIAVRDRRIDALEAELADARSAAHTVAVARASADDVTDGAVLDDDDLQILIVLDDADEPTGEPAADVHLVVDGRSAGAAARNGRVDAIAGDRSPTGAGSVVALTPDPEIVQPDDLTRVEGIGPKMQSALRSAGVLTFAELAATTEHEIRAAIVAAGMHFAPSVPTWARQARLLADGDDQALVAFQSTLVAGREPTSS